MFSTGCYQADVSMPCLLQMVLSLLIRSVLSSKDWYIWMQC